MDFYKVGWLRKGQDANFITGNAYVVFVNDDPTIENDTLYYFSISEPTVWNNDKPHVIYGLVVIENEPHLKLWKEQGLLHHNSNLVVGELWYRSNDVPIKSSLKVLGNNSNRYYSPQTDLMNTTETYQDNGVEYDLTANSSDNIIQDATIKNGTIGLHVDTVANDNDPTLRLKIQLFPITAVMEYLPILVKLKHPTVKLTIMALMMFSYLQVATIALAIVLLQITVQCTKPINTYE